MVSQVIGYSWFPLKINTSNPRNNLVNLAANLQWIYDNHSAKIQQIPGSHILIGKNSLNRYATELKAIGHLAKSLGIRLVIDCVIPYDANEVGFLFSFLKRNYEMITLMDLDHDAAIVTTYNDTAKWLKEYNNLPSEMKRYIVCMEPYSKELRIKATFPIPIAIDFRGAKKELIDPHILGPIIRNSWPKGQVPFGFCKALPIPLLAEAYRFEIILLDTVPPKMEIEKLPVKDYRIGYACINETLREKNIFCSRTARLNRIKKEGIDLAKSLAIRNIIDLVSIIQWNEDHNIRFFRLTSDLFPHPYMYSLSFAEELLGYVGSLVFKVYGHRITMHPGQYVQLGTKSSKVLKNSIEDLKVHAQILDFIGAPKDSVIVIHAGGAGPKGSEKESALRRWKRAYRKLPRNVRERLVLENDDYHYTVDDLLPLCEKFGIPLVVDFFHHECNPGDGDLDLQRIARTWKAKGIKPKCHYSQQKPNARKGSHSDYVTMLPKIVDEYCRKYGADLMIEAKKKELAALAIS